MRPSTTETAVRSTLVPEALGSDQELRRLLLGELERQRTTLQLIASENFTSPAVLAATASVLTNKYAEGYPGRRYYGGNAVADQVEDLARERAKSLFGAEHANVQPHAGANANLAAYLALVEPGDTILAMRLDQGGHLTHGSPVSVTGKLYRFVVTLTTHKTLRGPRGGAILCSGELARSIDSAVFPGLQGGPLEHVIAAKAVAFGEALEPEFADYAAQVVRNAAALAEALTERGFRLVAGGTDNHLVLIDLRSFDADLTGKVAQDVLDRTGITCNRNAIPNDPRPPFTASGLRLGSAAETTAGLGEAEMAEVAGLIGAALSGRDDESVLDRVRKAVHELCGRFDPYPGAPPNAG
jgi:glycine/serine hydroxymethyltransferase